MKIEKSYNSLAVFLPAIDKLIAFYSDKEACDVKNSNDDIPGWKCLNIDVTEEGICPLCKIAKETQLEDIFKELNKCNFCPWKIIELEECCGDNNILQSEDRFQRIDRLICWKKLILTKKGE